MRYNPLSIEIDGTRDQERHLVKIDEASVWLTLCSFKFFLILSYHYHYGIAGWVSTTDLQVGHNQARYLYRMKTEIQNGLNLYYAEQATARKPGEPVIVAPQWQAFENDRQAFYRLKVHKNCKIKFNNPVLAAIGDAQIIELTTEQKRPPFRSSREYVLELFWRFEDSLPPGLKQEISKYLEHTKQND